MMRRRLSRTPPKSPIPRRMKAAVIEEEPQPPLTINRLCRWRNPPMRSSRMTPVRISPPDAAETPADNAIRGGRSQRRQWRGEYRTIRPSNKPRHGRSEQQPGRTAAAPAEETPDQAAPADNTMIRPRRLRGATAGRGAGGGQFRTGGARRGEQQPDCACRRATAGCAPAEDNSEQAAPAEKTTTKRRRPKSSAGCGARRGQQRPDGPCRGAPAGCGARGG